jgi:hypothetical protein
MRQRRPRRPTAAVRAGRAAVAAQTEDTALAGCATLPPPPAKAPSQALADVEATTLARIAAASPAAGEPQRPGFRLLPEAPAAANARVALMRAARRPILL